MPDSVLELLRRRGCVRRRQLVQAGLSHRRINRLLRTGELRLLAADVLALPGPPAVDEELRAAVAALGGVVSGHQAALLRGWAMLTAPDQLVVTVARNRARPKRAGVTVIRRDIPPADLEELDGLQVTSSLRTALDCCRDLPLRDAVAVVDSALREGAVTEAELHAALVAMRPGRGRAAVARALSMVDPKSGSVLESACRVLLVTHGLAPEATQKVLRSGRSVLGRVDFCWPSVRLVVEVDGFEFHRARDDYRRDRRRSTALARAGWTVLRFSWEDVELVPTWVVESVRDAMSPCRRCAAA